MKRIFWSVALSATIISGSCRCADTFGTTHFIVGMPREEYKQYQQGSIKRDVKGGVHSRPLHKILFSPDDDIHGELLRLIQDELDSIKLAMYLFTDKEVSQALREAQLRGVCVECVTDASCIANRANKMDELAAFNIPVWVYRAANGSQSMGNAMHHKFMVFGSRKGGPSCKVVTGSLNITNSAQKSNQENIVVLCDEHSVATFDAQFEKLKTRCSRLIPQKNIAHVK